MLVKTFASVLLYQCLRVVLIRTKDDPLIHISVQNQVDNIKNTSIFMDFVYFKDDLCSKIEQ